MKVEGASGINTFPSCFFHPKPPAAFLLVFTSPPLDASKRAQNHQLRQLSLVKFMKNVRVT